MRRFSGDGGGCSETLGQENANAGSKTSEPRRTILVFKREGGIALGEQAQSSAVVCARRSRIRSGQGVPRVLNTFETTDARKRRDTRFLAANRSAAVVLRPTRINSEVGVRPHFVRFSQVRSKPPMSDTPVTLVGPSGPSPEGSVALPTPKKPWRAPQVIESEEAAQTAKTPFPDEISDATPAHIGPAS